MLCVRGDGEAVADLAGRGEGHVAPDDAGDGVGEVVGVGGVDEEAAVWGHEEIAARAEARGDDESSCGDGLQDDEGGVLEGAVGEDAHVDGAEGGDERADVVGAEESDGGGGERVCGEAAPEGGVVAHGVDVESEAGEDARVEAFDGGDEGGETLVGVGAAEEGEAEWRGSIGRPAGEIVVVGVEGVPTGEVEVWLAYGEVAGLCGVGAGGDVDLAEKVAWAEDGVGGVEGVDGGSAASAVAVEDAELDGAVEQTLVDVGVRRSEDVGKWRPWLRVGCVWGEGLAGVFADGDGVMGPAVGGAEAAAESGLGGFDGLSD